MDERADMDQWLGYEVVDRDGDKVGKLREVFVDREKGGTEWGLVNTGLFGTRSSFVPLNEAMRDEDRVRVPYEKGHIKDAPNVDDEEDLSPDEEQRLYAHYELDYSTHRSGRFARGQDPVATHEEQRS